MNAPAARIAFALERYADVHEECRPLHCAQWPETMGLHTPGDADPDYDTIIELEERGVIYLFTARLNNTLVGLMSYMLGDCLQQQGKLTATEMGLWIDPRCREKKLAVNLLTYAEDALRQLGVDYISLSDKGPAGGISLSLLADHLGYTPASITYTKVLEK